MTDIKETPHIIENSSSERPEETGFTITEFLLSVMILLIITSAVFALLTESQREASYQTEIQSVLNNANIAMQTVERYLRQAGNDPFTSGLSGITIISATELRVQSDIKGSCGSSNPHKGDPDGDIEDSDENVLIRFNPRSRSIEVVSGNGSPMISVLQCGRSYYN
jgi:type II secretory pathway pseudopilin PulG